MRLLKIGRSMYSLEGIRMITDLDDHFNIIYHDGQIISLNCHEAKEFRAWLNSHYKNGVTEVDVREETVTI